jgi:hypothetical protein
MAIDSIVIEQALKVVKAQELQVKAQLEMLENLKHINGAMQEVTGQIVFYVRCLEEFAQSEKPKTFEEFLRHVVEAAKRVEAEGEEKT